MSRYEFYSGDNTEDPDSFDYGNELETQKVSDSSEAILDAIYRVVVFGEQKEYLAKKPAMHLNALEYLEIGYFSGGKLTKYATPKKIILFNQAVRMIETSWDEVEKKSII